MHSNQNVNMTEGKILPNVIIYSLPIMAAGLLQVLYNAADLIVIGNFSGQVSVAAVGATGPITALIVNSFIGMSIGVSIILSQFFGNHSDERIKDAVHTSMLFSAILGFIIMCVMLAFSSPLLEATDCPEECLAGSVLYLNIYSIGIPANMIYNFGAAILKAKGNTKSPFIYLAVSGLVNVVLNVITVTLFSMDVDGVATATTVSQYLSAYLVVRKLMSLDDSTKLYLKDLRLKKDIVIKLIRYGTPSAIQNSLYSISNLQIQSAINSFGTAAISGNSAAASVESLTGTMVTSFGSAAIAFIGQNIGAKKPERVRRSILCCGMFCILIATVGGISSYLFGKGLLALYIPGEIMAIEYGVVRMKYNMVFYFITGFNNIFVSSNQAFGYSAIPAANSIFSILGIRTLWMNFIYPLSPTLDNVYVCYPITWAVSALLNGITLLIVYSRYRRGKVKMI